MELAGQLRQRLAAGHTALGSFVGEFRTPAIATLMGQVDLDFLLVDTEHGSLNPEDVAGHIVAAKSAGLTPWVRVSTVDRTEITRVLDAGAEGIMVPMVRSVEDARKAVAVSKYPPRGQRGAHFLRPHNNYQPPTDIGAYMNQANARLFTILQVETLEAAAQVDELAAVEGVDMLYIGPGDLSIAMGYPGQVGHPQVLEVVERMAQSCMAHGKFAGSHCNDPAMVAELVGRGIQVIGLGAVLRMLQVGMELVTAQARQGLKD